MWGDFDNDGDPDLFIRAGEGTLYRNQGDGTFAKVPTPALPTVSSLGGTWADLNNDGYLDLVIAHFGVPTSNANSVHINDRSGGFVSTGQDIGSADTLGISGSSKCLPKES